MRTIALRLRDHGADKATVIANVSQTAWTQCGEVEHGLEPEKDVFSSQGEKVVHGKGFMKPQSGVGIEGR